MYVVLGLGMGYAAAGGVVAAETAGPALGGWLLSRVIDGRGPRTGAQVAPASAQASATGKPVPVMALTNSTSREY
jgi:hypothetical protein